MARGSDINQRIVLQGADEVRRHLEEIAAAGQRAGNQTRSSLLAATSGAQGFTAGTRTAAATSGQLRFALQNLSFQVNDVATSLASGSDPMRVFAQQGGQLFQAFQQGGGFSTVIGGAATAIRGMITPMTAAAAGVAGLAAALGVLIARSVDATTAAKQFDAQLQGLGKGSRISGAELEKAAQRLRDIGIPIDDARKKLQAFNAAGGRPELGERIIRIGRDLERVFGEGTMDKFIEAAAKGGDTLREFAVRLGLLPKQAADAAAGLSSVSAATVAANQSIAAAIVSRNRSIADEQRSAAQQIADLTRKKGTAEEEIALASSRRIEEINRQSNIAINEQIAARNKAAQDSLAAFNKKIEDAAQAAATGGDSIVTQIETRVKGLDQQALGPVESTMRRLNVTWNDFLNTLSQSAPVQTTINEFSNILGLFTNINAQLERMAKNRAAFFEAGGPIVASAPIPGLAGGTSATPPGTILVGERGPELISQPGGLSVWTNAQTRQIMSAFAAMRFPAMPRSRRFAAGTLGNPAIGGGGVPVNIHIGGQNFALMGDRQVVGALTRAARRSATLSAGRLPSTA